MGTDGGAGVSARHCVLTREYIGNGKDYIVWAEDLRCDYSRFQCDEMIHVVSTNGTYVNRESIGKGKRHVLNSGDTFDLLWKGPSHRPCPPTQVL